MNAAAAPRAHNPVPGKGLSARDFKRIAVGGLGDGHNNYAHSMAWFQNKLYFGTTRSNLIMIRFQTAFQKIPLQVWPVECPETVDEFYEMDRRAQIWAYDPSDESWEWCSAPRWSTERTDARSPAKSDTAP